MSYSKNGNLAIACLAVFDRATKQVVETRYHHYSPTFPYVPGKLYDREREGFSGVWAELQVDIDLLVVDGNGRLHPQRNGLACLLGEEFDVPSFGIAKNLLLGKFNQPGFEKGSMSPILENEEVVGYALRTASGVKPIFISEGYSTEIEDLIGITLEFSIYRIPELTRQPDILSRDRFKKSVDSPLEK